MDDVPNKSHRGVLDLSDAGLKSETDLRTVRALLEDLPGVYEVAINRTAAALAFDPALASPQQIEQVLREAGLGPGIFREIEARSPLTANPPLQPNVNEP